MLPLLAPRRYPKKDCRRSGGNDPMCIKSAIARLLAAGILLGSVAGVSRAQDNVSCAQVPYEAAIPFCTRAIESGDYEGDELAGIYLNRGLRYAIMKDYDRALSDYTSAVKIYPAYAKGYSNRGSVYYDMRDYDKAMADFDEAIRVDPKFSGAYIGRGIVHIAKGDYERAIAELNEAGKLIPQPSSAAVFYSRGVAYLCLKQFDRALEEENQLIKIAPKSWIGFWARGLAHYASGKVDLALADFNTAVQLNPKAGEALYARGLAKLKKGDAGGNADIAAAKAINAKIAEIWSDRANPVAFSVSVRASGCLPKES